ncbi:MAG: hypothetical protein LBM61_04830 [Prevotellaceae bacterium]|nr:hypothetical protein [Prevotellaceae bacterium]
MQRKNLIIGLIVLLALAIGVVTYLLLSEKKHSAELIELFQLEKEELENEYNGFARQYDELQMTIRNDSLSVLLEREKTKVQRLLEELRTVKSTNAAEITRLKKEVATLRKVLMTYVAQVDSLNQLTEKQQKQIVEVTRKYNAASRQIDNLAQQKEQLTKQVTLAAQLDATNVAVVPKNKRNRTAKKVKDVTKLDISFTITKNITATTGEKTLYIRIMKPDNDVLTKDASDTFAYENRQLSYSIKKYIEYTGEEQSATVYWQVEEYLYAGRYRVDIFADGNLIGTQTFELQ